MAGERSKKKKVDWDWLMSLPKFQRDFEIKKLAKKEKEKKDDRFPGK
tara:strand:- start:233 stop:373 length:141 start_codon:yes stop_codon:yes gene_type:complete